MAVLDASAALAFLAPSQSTFAAQTFAASMDEPLIVPDLFFLEVRNALLRLERRGLVESKAWELALEQLETTLIGLPPLDANGRHSVVSLARANAISFFDASYLQAAIEENAALVSRDGPLIGAAQALGLKVLDLRDPPA